MNARDELYPAEGGIGGGPRPRSGFVPTTAGMTAVGGSMADSYVGRVVQNRYFIKRLIGEGGMGGVYEAEHLELGKRVAIKIVHALHARDPHVSARIRQEARATGAIESENIVEVFDAGDDEDLGIYLVMELLKGEDLASLLSGGRRISPVAAATMVLQAAQGLLRAHAAGIVHRDLKPANVFLSTREDGSSFVKLVDFGIAKLVRDANRANRGSGLTQAGMAIGTPHYMSPEQAQGLATVDHRTDMYSLGAVLYEACAGAPAFPELPTYEQTIVRIVTTTAPRLSSAVPDIDPELDRLCADMMAREPSARPRDMAAVRERLLRIFPEIDRGRLQINFRDDDVHLDASGPVSNVVPAIVDHSRGVPGSLWPSAPPPVSLDAIPIDYEDPDENAPALPRRRGAPFAIAIATIVLASAICLVALFKVHGARALRSSPAPVSFGLVESTVAAPQPAETVASPAPVAPTVEVPPQTPPAPPAAATQVTETMPTKAPPAPPAPRARPSRRRSPGTPVKYTSGALVGGTAESTEF